MTVIRNVLTSYQDSANLDAFSRLRVSLPTSVFDSQFTYTLQTLLFQQVTSGAGATITHDATNRCGLMSFSSTPTGGTAFMQSYEFFRYQPLKSQEIAVTFNFIQQVANVTKFAGYSDGSNGIEFRNNGTTNQIAILSTTSNGNQIINQASWNIDKLDGSGGASNPSGILLDITKSQILIIDFQALYQGRVRVGFDINGIVYYAHEFLHANVAVFPYIANANLPIRCGMTCTGTVTTTMFFTCCGIASEGGSEIPSSYEFAVSRAFTAGSGTRTHGIALRPRQLFNGIQNRGTITNISLEVSVTGSNPVDYEICFGQALTGASYSNVNTLYSIADFDIAGTLSGSPAIVPNRGTALATATAKGQVKGGVKARLPITLDVSGNPRDLGTVVVTCLGVGGTSTVRITLSWEEIR